MTDPRYDVVAIGNAIVDVMAPCEDELIDELDLAKGGMTLVDTERAKELYSAMGRATDRAGIQAAPAQMRGARRMPTTPFRSAGWMERQAAPHRSRSETPHPLPP